MAIIQVPVMIEIDMKGYDVDENGQRAMSMPSFYEVVAELTPNEGETIPFSAIGTPAFGGLGFYLMSGQHAATGPNSSYLAHVNVKDVFRQIADLWPTLVNEAEVQYEMQVQVHAELKAREAGPDAAG